MRPSAARDRTSAFSGSSRTSSTTSPTCCLVEFAVNDGGAPPQQIYRTMEGIVRQTWKTLPDCDICYVYTLVAGMAATLQDGKFPRAASAMEKIADHYGIPSIHLGLEVAGWPARAN